MTALGLAQAARFRLRRGFTLLELAISVSIMAIVTVVLLQRVEFYREQAERVAMEQVIAALRSALHSKLELLYISNRDAEITQMIDENPMQWLRRMPDNYLGEFYAPRQQEVAPGNWYFDREQKNLVFMLGQGNFFNAVESHPLKFKVKSVRLPSSPGDPSKPAASIDDVVLVQESR